MAAWRIGIGLGSFAAGYLSGGKIEYGLMPLGSVGMTVFSALARPAPVCPLTPSRVGLALLGFFGGFFIVPIAALLQHRPDTANKASVLAAANLLSFVGIFLASGRLLPADGRGCTESPRRFSCSARVLTLAGADLLSSAAARRAAAVCPLVLTRTLYRIRVVGRDNIPEKGGALFVCNHVSFVDALLLSPPPTGGCGS